MFANLVSEKRTHEDATEKRISFSFTRKISSLGSCLGYLVFGSCASPAEEEEEITIKTFYYYLAVTLYVSAI